MQKYRFVFEICRNGVRCLYSMFAKDYDEAMGIIYDHIKKNNLLHCYNQPCQIIIKFIDEETLEEIKLGS